MEYIELYANYQDDDHRYARATPGPFRLLEDLERFPEIKLGDTDAALREIMALSQFQPIHTVRLTGGAVRKFPGITEQLQERGYVVECLAAKPAHKYPPAQYFYPDLRTEFVALRRELGLSQPAAGEALGRSAGWIRGMEQGAIFCPPYAVYAMRYLSEHPETLTQSRQTTDPAAPTWKPGDDRAALR
jgi:hypothetical protein